MRRIGIIGLGSRMSSLLALIDKRDDIALAAVADPRVDEITAQLAVRTSRPPAAIYRSAEEMLAAEPLDGIMIGTRCSLHTPLALLCAKENLPIFLEKPTATSWEQYDRLAAIADRSDDFVVSFPLRLTPIVAAVKEIIDSGKIGRIRHVEAWNNVYYARGYYKKWYRDDSETGGLFLQKATHDFDYLTYLIGERPIRICAMKSKTLFTGEIEVGMTCDRCKFADECPESPENLAKVGEPKNGLNCCFAVDTGNEDSGSALIEYESGIHLAYTQDFIVRKSAGSRGARLIGYYGTVEFDFNKSEYRLIGHFDKTDERVRIDSGGNHSGGDDRLIDSFAELVCRRAKSRTPLTDGLLSAKLCLAARDSAEKRVFVDI